MSDAKGVPPWPSILEAYFLSSSYKRGVSFSTVNKRVISSNYLSFCHYVYINC